MQKRLIAILVYSLLESMLSRVAARVADPYTLSLEPGVSDFYVEIVPYPMMPYTMNPGSGAESTNPNEPPPIFPGMDTNPGYGCYRDARDPCIIYDDIVPMCICFDGFDGPAASPYIYFPPVEYPMSAMDIRPYYYGQSWCA